jgi:ABC-type Fe3+ transport system substrate-binding protein
VNREFVSTSDFPTSDQLIDPKFKGKITIYRPQQSSAGANALAVLLEAKGEDFVRKILVDQQAVATDNISQAVEWMIQGRYPIMIGATTDALGVYTSQGLGQKVEPLKEPRIANVSVSGVTVLKNPPHPNAIRVFMAWYLSKEGQDAWNAAGTADASSRRLDATVVNPDVTPDWTRLADYKVVIGTPSGDAFLDRALAIANEKH